MKGNHKHGFATKANRKNSSPEWRVYCRWRAMLNRCNNPNVKCYPDYGGRGITVCERWHSFENFYQDMGAPPVGMSIERVDNSKGYEPGNCCWADHRTQMKNRRNRRELTYNGLTMSMTEWAQHLGVPVRLLKVRLHRGWPVERVLNPELTGTHYKEK